MCEEASKWLGACQQRPAVEKWLVCFPCAGGGAALYHRAKALLHDTVGLIGIQLPGREGRLEEPPVERISPLADAISGLLSERISEPVALFCIPEIDRFVIRSGCERPTIRRPRYTIDVVIMTFEYLKHLPGLNLPKPDRIIF